jgi:hypothetical protein
MLLNAINRFYRQFHIDDIDNPSRYIQYSKAVLTDFNQLMDVIFDIYEALDNGVIAYNSKDIKWLNKLYGRVMTAIGELDAKHEQLANQLNNFFEDNGIFQTADSTDFRTQSGKAKWLDYLTDLDLGNKDIQQLKNYILNI